MWLKPKVGSYFPHRLPSHSSESTESSNLERKKIKEKTTVRTVATKEDNFFNTCDEIGKYGKLPGRRFMKAVKLLPLYKGSIGLGLSAGIFCQVDQELSIAIASLHLDAAFSVT